MRRTEIITLTSGRTAEIHTAGQGPKVVWLHGPHGLRKSDPVIAELSKRYTVIAPLAPGFRDIEELDDIKDVHELALHYDDILEALALDRVRLIGHSFGGMIAAELAAHVPHRVERLALLSPFGLWRDDCPVEDLFCRPYATIDTVLWKTGAAAGPMADASNFSADPVDAAVELVSAAAAVAKFIWPIPDKGLRRRLHRVSAQTLVVFGSEDQFVPARYADEFAREIRRARAVIVPDAAHMAPYEQTSHVLSLLEQHFAD
jgi:pimeloyl-ACP methyl ester carboxylesterase